MMQYLYHLHGSVNIHNKLTIAKLNQIDCFLLFGLSERREICFK